MILGTISYERSTWSTNFSRFGGSHRISLRVLCSILLRYRKDSVGDKSMVNKLIGFLLFILIIWGSIAIMITQVILDGGKP